MTRLAIGIAAVWTMTSAWAAERPRMTVDLGRIARPEQRAARVRAPRLRTLAQDAAKTAAIRQAPGVIQTNLLDASNIVWFVTAEKLPAGTELWAFVVFPDGSEAPLQALVLEEDIEAGSSLDLPNIRKFGPFWPAGMLTYGVLVTINGRQSQASADFPVASSRNAEAVEYMIPRIASASEYIKDGDVIAKVTGVFTSDSAYVLLDDVVVPREAIRVSRHEITVNLSRTPGLDLGSMREWLLTVGQSGWCDTAVFRHTPVYRGLTSALFAPSW